jgi:hypothetical protein
MELNQIQIPLEIAKLIIGFLSDSLSEGEHTTLDEWVCASMDNQRIFESLIG